MIGPANRPSTPEPSDTPAEARRAKISFELAEQCMENAEQLTKFAFDGAPLRTAVAAVLDFFRREVRDSRTRLVLELDDYEGEPLGKNEDVERELSGGYNASIDVLTGGAQARLQRLADQLAIWEVEVGLDLLAEVGERIVRCWQASWTREQKIAFTLRVIDAKQPDITARRLRARRPRRLDEGRDAA